MLSRLMPNAARETFAQDCEAFEAAVDRHSGRRGATMFVDVVKSISRVDALMAAACASIASSICTGIQVIT
jgi:hypothetical protein